MRLSSEYRGWLRNRLSQFGTPYLFGSRTDLNAKGGDIDILLLTDKKLSFRQLAEIRKDFILKFGDQKLDIVNYTFQENDAFKNLIMIDAKAL